MLGKVRARLTYANVISTIALFAALGGGYAVALSGSGSLERAKEVGIEGSPGFETVLKLSGIGRLQASCTGTGSPVSLRFKNTSGKELISRAFEENEDAYNNDGSVEHGDPSTAVGVGVGAETIHWHVTPAGGGDEPQADMSVAVTPSIVGSPSCAKAEVAVIATTTEQ